ncbi:hypothetical protein PR048_006719 [Dryococelus australis]|uniref:PiggyBac transposable element-derived protein domain-containing protein n=1 Tax=Dryococelus australis TaxID=614101 RepID=A0ABQ9IBQ6_9NEOP|nr:hypothetical protein PR048_006719 [Dryococelus australis]
MLCNTVVNITWGFIFIGEQRINIKEYGQDYTVTMKLSKCANLLNKEYHVFVDNFFSRLPVAMRLYANGTFLTGMIRKNQKHIPSELLLIAYCEEKSQNKPVILLSTSGKLGDVQSSVKWHGRVKVIVKSVVIYSYSKYMGGIDSSNILCTYLDER